MSLLSCSTVRDVNLETDHINLYLKKGTSRMLHRATYSTGPSLEPCLPPKRERGFGLTLTPLSSWSVEGGPGYKTVIEESPILTIRGGGVVGMTQIVLVFFFIAYM